MKRKDLDLVKGDVSYSYTYHAYMMFQKSTYKMTHTVKEDITVLVSNKLCSYTLEVIYSRPINLGLN